MSKLSIKDLDLAGKRVFIRVDFNVPLDKASGRIRGLQATAAEHEKNIEALKKELGALKP